MSALGARSAVTATLIAVPLAIAVPKGEQDPCTLVSAAEMRPWVGALATPQFRATDDDVPDKLGERCVYRGTDGREVTIGTQSGGGRAGGAALRDIPTTLGAGLAKGGATGMDTMANRG